MVEHCIHCCSLQVAPATKESVQRQYTIPDLLDLGCAYDYEPALYNWSSHGWQTYSYRSFRIATEEFALGLGLQELHSRHHEAGISGRMGLMLDNDIHWVLVDMGSLLAGLVTVPIDDGQSLETIKWIIADAGLSALVVPDWKTVKRLYKYLAQLSLVIVVEDSSPPAWPIFSNGHTIFKSLAEICDQGRQQHSPDAVHALKAKLHPDDLATIVYTADAEQQAKGVMLSHENLTGNIWAAFSSMPGLVPGTPEIGLSFLPLNHIFARSFLYGHLGFGHYLYLSSPQRVFRHLAEVKPTIFITVPRLLEKVYERINNLRKKTPGWQGCWLALGWWLAHHYNLGPQEAPWRRLQRWFLGCGIFGSLPQAFGGKIRYLLCGGAALRPEVMTFFNAVGIPVRQGYGLTETSSVLSYTRDRWLRSGTVGTPIPGVAMRLADDGEVLVKSPYTMVGYYHNPAATDAVIDEFGWFHTGDFGAFSEDGLLTLQGCKKELFKLSTGKYVAPGPIEAQLERSPLVRRALLVGPGQKFCGVLIVPAVVEIKAVTSEQLVWVRSQLQTLIDHVNERLPHWSTIKRFTLIKAQVTTAENRTQQYHAYAQEIDQLYCEPESPSVPQITPKRLSNWWHKWPRFSGSVPP